MSDGLRAAITSTVNQKERAPLKRIAVEKNNRLVFLDTADIQCIEAHRVHAHSPLVVINRNHVREIGMPA